MATVSVLIAFSRDEQYLQPCLRRLSSQSFYDFEVVIVNDGCLTELECSKVSIPSNLNVRFISHEKTLGLAASLNEAATHASGDFYARMDLDEWSECDRFQKQIDLMRQEEDIAVIGTGFRYFDESYGVVAEFPDPFEGESPGVMMRTNGPRFCHASVMIRASSFHAVGGYDERFKKAQDLDLWLKLINRFGKNSVAVISEVLHTRRIDGERLLFRAKQRYYGRVARKKNGGPDWVELAGSRLLMGLSLVGVLLRVDASVIPSYRHYMIATMLYRSRQHGAFRVYVRENVWPLLRTVRGFKLVALAFLVDVKRVRMK